MVKKIIDKVSLIMSNIGAYAFLIIVLIVIANIIGRTIFNSPISGTIEMVQYGVLICIGIALARTGFTNRHIRVSILVDKFPKPVRTIFKALAYLIGCAAFGLVSYLFFREAPIAIASGKMTDALKIPFEYIYILLGIFFAVAAIVWLYQVIEIIMIGFSKKGDDSPNDNNEQKQLVDKKGGII